MLNTTIITGYHYGLDSNDRICAFTCLEKEHPPVIWVKSQYGWQDGCRDQEFKVIVNPQLISGYNGDSMNCGSWEVSGTIIHDCKNKQEAICLLSNIAQEWVDAENDPNDCGQSECCPGLGRMKYSGGSRYSCNYCGKEEIRPVAGFVKA